MTLHRLELRDQAPHTPGDSRTLRKSQNQPRLELRPSRSWCVSKGTNQDSLGGKSEKMWKIWLGGRCFPKRKAKQTYRRVLNLEVAFLEGILFFRLIAWSGLYRNAVMVCEGCWGPYTGTNSN